MNIEVQVAINGTREAVWQALLDLEKAAEILSGVEKVEVLERPPTGLVGLKWRETRILFGKPASADKWIIEAVENEYYIARAEDNGFVFITTMRISEESNGLTLISTHESRPQTFGAKVMSIPMKLFFKGVAKKAILQDLNDYKAAIERK